MDRQSEVGQFQVFEEIRCWSLNILDSLYKHLLLDRSLECFIKNLSTIARSLLHHLTHSRKKKKLNYPRVASITHTMSSTDVISYDEAKNSAFDNVLHKQSKNSQGGIRAMMSKNSTANGAASDEYFQFWDNKKAEDEVEAIRQERTDNYASLTRQ